MEEREFPETDVTKWVLRTKSAPLSASGTHEVVASGMSKGQLASLARLSYGPYWRQTYELVRRR